jgi:hypothetical protein
MRKFLAAIDCHGLTNQHGDFWIATWDGSMSWRIRTATCAAGENPNYVLRPSRPGI